MTENRREGRKLLTNEPLLIHVEHSLLGLSDHMLQVIHIQLIHVLILGKNLKMEGVVEREREQGKEEMEEKHACKVDILYMVVG